MGHRGSGRYAIGDKAVAICERCSEKRLRRTLVYDGQFPDLLVCTDCWDPKHPQEYLPPAFDPVTIYDPTGDPDKAAANTLKLSFPPLISSGSSSDADSGGYTEVQVQFPLSVRITVNATKFNFVAGDPDAVGENPPAPAWPAINSFTQTDSSEFFQTESRSFTFGLGGKRGYVCANSSAGNGGGIHQSVSFGTAWDPDDTVTPSRILVIKAWDMLFNDDGTKVYVVEESPNRIAERTNIGTPFEPGVGDIDTVTGTYTIPLGTAHGIHFKADGTKFWYVVGGGELFEVTMSVPWDLDTATATTSKTGLPLMHGAKFSPDGLTAYLITTTTVHEYSMSSAFDISTLTDTTRSIASNTGGAGGGTYGFSVSPDAQTLIIQTQWGNAASNNDSIRWIQ